MPSCTTVYAVGFAVILVFFPTLNAIWCRHLSISCQFMKMNLRKWNYLYDGFFFMNFDFKNELENEFWDNKEKSCSWSRNTVFHRIGFKTVWPRNGHADSVGFKPLFLSRKYREIFLEKFWTKSSFLIVFFTSISRI